MEKHKRCPCPGGKSSPCRRSGSGGCPTEFVVVGNSFTMDDLAILGSIARYDSTKVIARRDCGVEWPSELKGKEVGVMMKSNAEFLLVRFIALNGLSPQEIDIVPISPKVSGSDKCCKA